MNVTSSWLLVLVRGVRVRAHVARALLLLLLCPRLGLPRLGSDEPSDPSSLAEQMSIRAPNRQAATLLNTQLEVESNA